MNVLGLHLLLELKECNPQLLDDLSYVRSALIRAAEDVGAHIVGESFHRFTPQGVTGILSIAESHISIHTWPEYGYARGGHLYLRRILSAPAGGRRPGGAVRVPRPGNPGD